MYHLSKIETGDIEQVRRIEAITGIASTEQIEQVLKIKPNATLEEIYLILANTQNKNRLGNA